MSLKKPKIGDLVQLKDPFEGHDGWHSPPGVIVECVGIRCKVVYVDGVTGHPKREDLEVL